MITDAIIIEELSGSALRKYNELHVQPGCIVEYVGIPNDAAGRQSVLLKIGSEYLVMRTRFDRVTGWKSVELDVGPAIRRWVGLASVRLVSTTPDGWVLPGKERVDNPVETEEWVRLFNDSGFHTTFPNDRPPQHPSPNDPFPAELMGRIHARIAEFRAFRAA